MNKFKITEKGINFLLIFILGFLVGVAIKSEAQKRITIGYNDYLSLKYKQDIDLMAPAENPAESAENGQDAQPQPTEQIPENQAEPPQNGE